MNIQGPFDMSYAHSTWIHFPPRLGPQAPREGREVRMAASCVSCGCLPSATPQPAPCSAEPAPTPPWPPGRSAAHAACACCPWAHRQQCRHLVPASDVAVGPWSFCNTAQGEMGSEPSADNPHIQRRVPTQSDCEQHLTWRSLRRGEGLWESSSIAVHEAEADYSTILGRVCGLKNQRTNRLAWEGAS